MIRIFLMVLLTGILGGMAGAATEKPWPALLLDGGTSPTSWRFVPGAEFPGAKGGIGLDSERGNVRLNFDFSGGGRYVAAYPLRRIPAGVKGFAVTLLPCQNMKVNYRILDGSGRVFQGRSVVLTKGVRTQLIYTPNGPWSAVWGGDARLKQPTALSGLWLLVDKSGSETPQGWLNIEEVSVLVDQLPAARFSGKDFTVNSSGWELNGKWQPQPEGALLKVTAIRRDGAAPAELSFDFPEMARDSICRYRLDPARTEQAFFYQPPIAGKGNERNVYRIIMRVAAGNGEATSLPLLLVGAKASAINLGQPMNSRAIKASRFGTCTHFSYGTSGAFKGWKPYEQLLDEIAACGFKWIRDGVKLEEDASGNYHIRPYDLAWVKSARSRGIRVIMVIGMYSRDDLPEFLKQVEAVVRGSEGLVEVFELGNEPNNFGDWIKKYGGTWNGREKDNSTSPWVKAHLRYTNAAADLIRKLRPRATVLGTGACAPTNFRYLELGLSKNVDGLVEHPYSFSLPPEKVPFGLALEKRDGIKVGDRDHTFAGLINSYLAKSRATGKERQIWVTEFGFSTFWFNGQNEKKLYAGFTEEAQAVYLLRRLLESIVLPVTVTCQYDFIDDYGSAQYQDEANFGLIRADHSRKPAYTVLQRFNSLFHGAVADHQARVRVVAEPLHRSSRRGELVKSWDDVAIHAANGVKAIALTDPQTPGERMLVVWSVLPFSREFNNRVCALQVEGWPEFQEVPVAVDLISGRSFDLPVRFENGIIKLDQLVLKGSPVLIKFFRK